MACASVVAHGLGHDAGLARDIEELLPILARQVGDRDDLPLFPQQAIGKARDVGHVDAGADHAAAFAHRFQCRRHERADGREDDRAVERFGRRRVGGAGPAGAELAGEVLPGDIARPGERENVAALPAGHLRDDVSRGAEPVQAELPPFARDAQRTPPDQSGAQQRRGRDIVAVRRQRKDETRIGHHMRRIAAIAGVAGEQRPVAQVFLIARAIGTDTAGRTEPWHADPDADPQGFDAGSDGVDLPDDLVTGNDRQLWIGQLAVDHMQVGAADAASRHAQSDLTGPGLGVGHLRVDQRLARLPQLHGMHDRPFRLQARTITRSRASANRSLPGPSRG